jgi:hypothetical protein
MDFRSNDADRAGSSWTAVNPFLVEAASGGLLELRRRP